MAKFAINLYYMYDYMEVRINANPCDETITDLLAAFLADIDFESFLPDEKGLTAYVRNDKFRFKELENLIENFPISCNLSLESKLIQGQDWNKEWEQNYFKPILIDDKLVVRSSFHTDYPSAPIEIIIDPKMAFGTGHHATTSGMARMLMEEDLSRKTVIDMGTGTGILAIIAKKLGAGETIGIDIDEFAIENARENVRLNNVDCKMIVGDDHALENLLPSDIFLANINLNVITSFISVYKKYLKSGGILLLSGFLTEDRETILDGALKNGFSLVAEKEENNWLTLKFTKN
ncbi:MAG: 50S ribosomal protein L11 methyltransferase [Muribaculaceae bacterium]|nr:50S ribosomal protein L11 methyltransferase [Muribaculaceae bacterium]